MMSEKDVKLGISGGKEPIYVVLDKKYGVLSEDDLFSPEISRILALGGSQLIIGTTRPVNKKQDLIKYVAITRSVENGISYLINGEMIENEDGEIVGYTPTFIATPDSLVYKEAEDEDSIVLVESSMITQNKEGVNTRLNGIESIIYGLCKSIKKTKMNEKPIPKPEG
jgi:hypothetical protein